MLGKITNQGIQSLVNMFIFKPIHTFVSRVITASICALYLYISDCLCDGRHLTIAHSPIHTLYTPYYYKVIWVCFDQILIKHSLTVLKHALVFDPEMETGLGSINQCII